MASEDLQKLDRDQLIRRLEHAERARRELGEQADHLVTLLGQSRREILWLRKQLEAAKQAEN